jgi:Na+/H+ antiporter NhaD/arsenite permease-like protein
MTRARFPGRHGNLQFFAYIFSVFLTPVAAIASDGTPQDFSRHWIGIVSLVLFILAYSLVIAEESLHIRKSKPVMVAAGIIWSLTAFAYAGIGDTHFAETAMRHNLLEFAELFLFLLAAMTYINTMQERGIFAVLRAWLISKGFSLRAIFWLTGILAFFISPIADNLTTAILMATVVMTVGGNNTGFVVVSCINIVVAANAGGAFSPFGDITTLMVWQKGVLQFNDFFALFVPSAVNWLVPAILMAPSIPKIQPQPVKELAVLRHGGLVVVALFFLTIVMAVCAHHFLHMPPVLGMMTGLGILKFYGYYLRRLDDKPLRLMANDCTVLKRSSGAATDRAQTKLGRRKIGTQRSGFDVFKSLERAEWDTLMFFYGVILCVGGLGALGYLTVMSYLMYTALGATYANILVGIFSALIDNIPIMFAVLSMMPDMNQGQWLLVTLTAGVGGSLLSIGSAAGVAVMGQARGVYTFVSHLRWSWAIALGYAAGIWVHFLINGGWF